jgi:hypothetical protein
VEHSLLHPSGKLSSALVVESNRGALRKTQLLGGSLPTWFSDKATGPFRVVRGSGLLV